MKKILLKVALALGLGAIHTADFAQGWAKKFAQDQSFFIPMLTHQKTDQSYIIMASNANERKVVFQQISANGIPTARTQHDSIGAISYAVVAGNGDIAAAGIESEGGLHHLRLMRLNQSGQKRWLKTIASNAYVGTGNTGIDTTNDGGFVVAFRTDSFTLTVVRTDSLGNTVWSNNYPQTTSNYIVNIVSTNDGGFVVQKSLAPKLFKVDANGNLLWQYNDALENIKLAQDGNLLAYGNANNHPYIKKIDQNGNDLWIQNYPILPDSATLSLLIEKDNDQYAFVSHAYGHYDPASRVYFRKYGFGKTDANGNYLFHTQLPTSNFGYTADILFGGTQRIFTETSDNGYFLTGWSGFSGGYGGFAWTIKIDSAGRSYPSTITGYVYDDTNSNCLRDSSEQALYHTNISLTGANDTLIVAVNPQGFFSLGVNEGTYDISLESISPYWATSSCNLSTINVASNTDTIILLGYNALAHAPYIVMNSESRAGGIPLFARSTTYTLQYKNLGTEDFIGNIEVLIDSNLVVDSASVPYTLLAGNKFLTVATQAAMGSSLFNIYMHASDPTNLDLIGRTLCFHAHAYNDTIYNPSPLWDGSNLALSAIYNTATDSVEFTLKNKGLGGMSSPKALTVIEDNVILISLPKQLLPNEIFSLRVPANGSTWRATIEQTPHNPYSRFVTVAIEGAGTNSSGSVSTGFVNQYPINGFYAYDYSLCSEVVASYDPNHKYVSPKGIGEEHLIDTTTDLEYTITFQNTGNHQAYNIRIVDTLANYLNPASIKAGVSSHRYEINFLQKDVVEFLFNDINLPDSASDEAGSQGFVKFKIRQRANNEIGTTIHNDVAIYFDYNEPVITNKATVKIGEVIISGIQNLYNENVEISAYPNPFTEQTTIKVAGENLGTLTLNVFDVQGRNIRQITANNGNQFILHRDELANGMYVFEIRTNNQTIIGTGKIVVN